MIAIHFSFHKFVPWFHRTIYYVCLFFFLSNLFKSLIFFVSPHVSSSIFLLPIINYLYILYYLGTKSGQKGRWGLTIKKKKKKTYNCIFLPLCPGSVSRYVHAPPRWFVYVLYMTPVKFHLAICCKASVFCCVCLLQISLLCCTSAVAAVMCQAERVLRIYQVNSFRQVSLLHALMQHSKCMCDHKYIFNAKKKKS